MSEHRHHKNRTATVILGAVMGILLIFCALLLLKEKHQEQTAAAEGAAASGQKSAVGAISYQGKEYVYNDHLSHFLFLGIDTRGEVEAYQSQRDAGQADAVFLVSMDRMEKALQVLSIPRDTMTEIEAFNPSGKSLGKTEDHINLQYGFGDGKYKSCDLMKEAVSNLLYDLPIQGYCSINMDGIPVLTDLAGGVEVLVPDDSLEDTDPEFIQGAKVTLTGENVEIFVRSRDLTVSQSALVRQNHQKVFLEAYLQKARELSAKDDSFITEMYQALQPYMITNMGNDLFADLLEAAGGDSVRKETLPGEGVEGSTGFDEYQVDQEALYELVLSMFYKENS